QIEVASGRSVVCTPLLVQGDSCRALKPVIINGRDRHILYERAGRTGNDEIEIRRKNKTAQSVEYRTSIPRSRWMEKSELCLVTDLCGCGWKSLENDRSHLFDIRLAEPVVLVPALAYRTPEAEAVKARSLEGKAFLDFPVNKTEIYPDYRNNPRELKAIRETVESVRDDKYATITEVYIKGFASPEGTYAGNAYLAEHRAKALRDYVKGLYRFDRAAFTVDSEPEDWAGLEAAVEQGDLPDKEELLAVIRADGPEDFDAREWKLKNVNGGTSYRKLLQEVYPGLRHSDYAVKYTIRNFTVDEARELLYKDPRQLSLNEMFQVAQTCQPGSEAFSEVFDIAVRMYPDDPVSNLNAANTAIRNGKTDAARRYLAKAGDLPEKRLAEAAIAMLEGDLDRAEQLLTGLEGDAAVGEAAADNLRQIRAKREE
ncbi:MAG: hypothetical protein Q4E62_09115, partial [Sutterellaceae bacterium]|nr:hypothetical protein [Sutterellaceae bacterium]